MDLIHDLPMGFGMALLQNEAAARAFYALPPEKQQEIIARTHPAASKSEMKALVSGLVP